MKIKVLKKASKKLQEFNNHQWSMADLEHFGKVLEWKKERFTIVISEGKDIVGSLAMKIEREVAYIGNLIVSKEKRRAGIGKMLIEKAEKIAKEKNAHKTYLQTGKGWDAVKFYEALGYKITGELPNHYYHRDFVELTKFL